MPDEIPSGGCVSFTYPANYGDVFVFTGSVDGLTYVETVTITPEVSTLALLACSGGLPLLGWLRRRRK